MSPVIIAPLVSAFLYAFAAMALKRATTQGVGPWRICFVTNWIQALLFAPLWFLGTVPFSWVQLGQTALAGTCFFVGQIFTFLALSRGDVSVVTPVLGTKVVMVAGFTVLLIGEQVPLAWWVAAAMTVVATALLGGGSPVKTSELTFRRSLVYGFSAATMFALTDVLLQRWSSGWGFLQRAPVLFLTVGVLSLGLIPIFGGRLRDLPADTWRWLVPGAVILSLQAFGIAYAIMNFGQATLVNILYTSRGVWTIAIVWIFGHWFANAERTHGRAVMLRRLAGSALILVAVKLAVR
jgi:drug/metabolite transporter (DMT)-like permease